MLQLNVPPSPVLAGSLDDWQGASAAGTWTLEAVDGSDDGVATDGEIATWSLEIDAWSSDVVTVTGDLHVDGAVKIGAGAEGCDSSRAGQLHFDPTTQRLYLCDGSQVLQLKACSTQCAAASELPCGAALTDGCGNACSGAGVGLDTVACAVGLARHLLANRKDSLGSAEVDHDITTVTNDRAPKAMSDHLNAIHTCFMGDRIARCPPPCKRLPARAWPHSRSQ